MEPKDLIKLIGAGVFVIGTLLWLIAKTLFGSAFIFVVAPPNAPASVKLDGADPITIPANGNHRFEVRGTITVDVTVNGVTKTSKIKADKEGLRFIAPATDNQCFVQFDVTPLFARRGSRVGPPTVVERFGKPGAVVPLPKGVAISEQDVPTAIKGGSMGLMKAFDCAELSKMSGSDLVQTINL